MLTAAERLLALRYLRSRRRSHGFSAVTWLSLIAIGFGVFFLVATTSAMNGLQSDLIFRILGVSPHLLVQPGEQAKNGLDGLREQIAELPGVMQVAPVVRGDGLAAAGKRSAGARIVGIAAEDLLARPIIADQIVEGRLADFQGPSVVIGASLARNLGVAIGGRVKLIIPKRDPETGSLIPRGQSFTVAAVFETRRDEYDSLLVFLTLPAAEQLFETDGKAMALDILMEEPLEVDKIRSKVEALAGSGASIKTWQDLNSSLVAALQVERVATTLILFLMIVVAAFGIAVGQVMMVKDKAREIAILRTMGATQGAILRTFMVSGLFVGIAGAAIGCAFGLISIARVRPMSQSLYNIFMGSPLDGILWFFAHLPSNIQYWQVAAIVGITLVLTLLASIYPAWRAARLDPVEALRYE